MDEEHQVSPFFVSALEKLNVGLVDLARADKAVQPEADGHATCHAYVCPCPSVLRFLPVRHTSEGLDSLDILDAFCECKNTPFMGKTSDILVACGTEELAAGHEHSGEEEGRTLADVVGSVEVGVKEVDERIEAEEEGVEESLYILLSDDSCLDGIFGGVGKEAGEETRLGRGMRAGRTLRGNFGREVSGAICRTGRVRG